MQSLWWRVQPTTRSVPVLVVCVVLCEQGGSRGWREHQARLLWCCSVRRISSHRPSLPPPLWPPPCWVQLYKEQIYDLLERAGQGAGPLGQRVALRLKEDTLGRVFVEGLSEVGGWVGALGDVLGSQQPLRAACGRAARRWCSHAGGAAVASGCQPGLLHGLRSLPPPDATPNLLPCVPSPSGGGGQRRRGARCAAPRLAPAPARRDRPQLQLLPLTLHLHGACVPGGGCQGNLGGRQATWAHGGRRSASWPAPLLNTYASALRSLLPADHALPGGARGALLSGGRRGWLRGEAGTHVLC